jgi:hypothetical protein
LLRCEQVGQMGLVAEIKEAQLAGVAIHESGHINVHLSGSSDMLVEEAFAAFLDELHQASLKLQVPKVTMDLKAVEFVNSRCIKSLVLWINRVCGLEPSSRYQILLLSDPDVLWQRRVLGMLEDYAADVVSVETPGG